MIHFGLLKTGTTSIQQALFSPQINKSFSYVHLGTPFMGRLLMKAFCQPPWRIASDLTGIDLSDQEAARGAFGRAIAERSSELLIVSSEGLSLFSEAELADFIDFLRSHGLQLEAVAYVRDCQAWTESLLQQSVKYGTWEMSLFPMGMGAYRFAIEKFDRLLGRDNVHLWKYDRAEFPGGCVVRDFFQRLGLGPYTGAARDLNTGLGLNAVKLLWAYHRSSLGGSHDPASFALNGKLAAHMKSLAGPPVRFHPSLMAERMQIDAADIAWVEERLGVSVQGTAPSCDETTAIRSEADLDDLSAESLQWLGAQTGITLSKEQSIGDTQLQVARAMVALRDKLGSAPQVGKSRVTIRQNIPKLLWIFWGQGLEQAPDLVKHCVASWREMNSSWDVRVLTEATAEPFLRKAAIPWERLDTFPLVKRSDILRLRLLTEHGGVWADATTFCLQPLDEWLPDCMRAGFFCFRDPGADRLVANWFLASDRGDRLAILWRDAHEAFMSGRDYLHHNSYDGNSAALPPVQRHLLRALHAVLDRNTTRTDLWFHPVVRILLRTYPYCFMHYLFAHGCRRNRQWQELFSQMPYRKAKPLLAPYTLVREGKSFAEIIKMGQEQALPMLKFNWKAPPAGLSYASP